MNQRLTLTDIATLLAQRENITPQQAEEFLRAFFQLTDEGLERDKFVKVTGFGTTKIVEVSERESVNVNTGERIQIGSHSKVSFTPDNHLRELVNRPFDHFTTITLHEDTSEEELEAANEAELPSLLATHTDVSTASVPEENSLPNSAIKHSVVEAMEVPEEESSPVSPTPLSPTIAQSEATPEQVDAPKGSEDSALHTAPFVSCVQAEALVSDALSPITESEAPSTEDVLPISPSATSEESITPTGSEEIITPAESVLSSDALSERNTAPLLHTSSSTATLNLETDQSNASHITNIQGSIVVKTEETTPHEKISFWKTAFFITLALFLCALSFLWGYYQGVRTKSLSLSGMPTTAVVSDTMLSTKNRTADNSDNLATSSSTSLNATSATNDVNNPSFAKPPASEASLHQVSSSLEKDLEKPQKSTISTQNAPPSQQKVAHSATSPKVDYTTEARKYQQLSRGKALIVGTLRTHTFRTGDNLYRLARKTYGSNEFASYIILYNGITDPDVIQLNQEIKLPKLIDKEKLTPLAQ